jgi:hypothetical protein
MKKRSVTNLRFDFQPDIMIEVDDPTKKHIHQECSPKDMKSPGKFLSTDPSKFKKQKTLSVKREQKREDKQKIKKSETRTSKWSTFLKSTQKGGKRSPCQSKTIERKFTISSSISSIR